MKHPAAEDPIPPLTKRRLESFVDLLLHWNQRVNLLARADERCVWDRHVWDSAQLARLLPGSPGTLLDLGAGAGFPGLVLAIVSGRPTHLVEADHRKAAFLREAVRATGVQATVHAGRIETLSSPIGDIVTARAVAALPALLKLAVPHLRPGGVCLFPKGGRVEDELTAARHEWHMKVERFPSRTSPSATLLRLSEITRAAPSG